MPDSLPWDRFTNDNPVSANSAEPVVIIGAGLAGCWMARTLADNGISVIVLEAAAMPASGASSNPAGIVKPYVTRSPSLAMDFYVQSHRHLLHQLSVWNLTEASRFNACGVVQLVEKPYPHSCHYRCLLPGQMQETIGIHCDSHGILFEDSGWLDPSALCHVLVKHPRITMHSGCNVKTIKPLTDRRWEIIDASQASWITSHFVITAGASITRLPPCANLPITPARGQISRFAGTSQTALIKRVVSGKHYLIPDIESVVVGATFERGVCDDSLKPDDDQSNRQGLSTMLPALQMTTDTIQSHAGVRATTPDRLPLVGPVPDLHACNQVYADVRHGRKIHTYPSLPHHGGAYVLGGLGSRGIVTAPFAARLLSDHLLGGDELSQWTSLVNPARFQIRALKRAKVTQL